MAQLIALKPLFERISAPERKFKEVVIFVHHYGGHRRSFKRQIELVTSLGFDVITFDLPLSQLRDFTHQWPISRYWSFGLRHHWADKIDEVLSQVPEDKIIFSFSSPSAAALMAIGRRHAVGICGWICDGGPFLHLQESIDNLLREGAAEDLKHKVFQVVKLRKALSHAFAFAMGLSNYERDMKAAFHTLPNKFPILSFRGALDPLVRPEFIDDFFRLRSENLLLTTINLPHTGHLNGMTADQNLYVHSLREFLLTLTQT